MEFQVIQNFNLIFRREIESKVSNNGIAKGGVTNKDVFCRKGIVIQKLSNPRGINIIKFPH